MGSVNDKWAAYEISLSWQYWFIDCSEGHHRNHGNTIGDVVCLDFADRPLGGGFLGEWSIVIFATWNQPDYWFEWATFLAVVESKT